jgi:hypothetical protein
LNPIRDALKHEVAPRKQNVKVQAHPEFVFAAGNRLVNALENAVAYAFIADD